MWPRATQTAELGSTRSRLSFSSFSSSFGSVVIRLNPGGGATSGSFDGEPWRHAFPNDELADLAPHDIGLFLHPFLECFGQLLFVFGLDGKQGTLAVDGDRRLVIGEDRNSLAHVADELLADVDYRPKRVGLPAFERCGPGVFVLPACRRKRGRRCQRLCQFPMEALRSWPPSAGPKTAAGTPVYLAAAASAWKGSNAADRFLFRARAGRKPTRGARSRRRRRRVGSKKPPAPWMASKPFS